VDYETARLPTYTPYPRYLNRLKTLLGVLSASLANLLQAGLLTSRDRNLHQAFR